MKKPVTQNKKNQQKKSLGPADLASTVGGAKKIFVGGL